MHWNIVTHLEITGNIGLKSWTIKRILVQSPILFHNKDAILAQMSELVFP